VADDFVLHPAPCRLLEGRRALVTGATTGIGQGAAYELAAGGRAIDVQMDITSEEEVEAGFARAREAFGGLDLLVNNAGVEAPFELVDMPLEEWNRVLEVNLTGVFLGSREAARIMRADDVPGTIVMVSSVHEKIPWKKFSHYCASKGGLKLFAQSIARELAPHGIRVVSVAPGAIETPINRDVLNDPQQKAEVLEEIPLGRWGSVDDVAQAIAWVASDRASYVTGTTLFVDGGMALYPRFV
jgi:glucose 1-dehydrogenase